MNETRERLIQLLSQYFDIGDSYTYNLTRDKAGFAVGTVDLDDFEEYAEDNVADLADYLLDNGAIVPPVKVGQTVWYIKGGYYNATVKKARAKEVTEINIKRQNGRIEWGFIADGTRYKFTSIGKTVFLTREAAEEALKAREKQ